MTIKTILKQFIHTSHCHYCLNSRNKKITSFLTWAKKYTHLAVSGSLYKVDRFTGSLLGDLETDFVLNFSLRLSHKFISAGRLDLYLAGAEDGRICAPVSFSLAGLMIVGQEAKIHERPDNPYHRWLSSQCIVFWLCNRSGDCHFTSSLAISCLFLTNSSWSFLPEDVFFRDPQTKRRGQGKKSTVVFDVCVKTCLQSILSSYDHYMQSHVRYLYRNFVKQEAVLMTERIRQTLQVTWCTLRNLSIAHL